MPYQKGRIMNKGKGISEKKGKFEPGMHHPGSGHGPVSAGRRKDPAQTGKNMPQQNKKPDCHHGAPQKEP